MVVRHEGRKSRCADRSVRAPIIGSFRACTPDHSLSKYRAINIFISTPVTGMQESRLENGPAVERAMHCAVYRFVSVTSSCQNYSTCTKYKFKNQYAVASSAGCTGIPARAENSGIVGLSFLVTQTASSLAAGKLSGPCTQVCASKNISS